MTKNKEPKSHQLLKPFNCQRGVVAVEMAVLVILMTLLMAGIFEFARAFWYYNALSKSTRDAARFMSNISSTDIINNSNTNAAITTAKNLALITANGANVKPALTASNIDIKCDSGACNGTKPSNVTVSIINFSVTIGSLFPFVSVPGGNYGSKTLSPSTTMRYMN